MFAGSTFKTSLSFTAKFAPYDSSLYLPSSNLIISSVLLFTNQLSFTFPYFSISLPFAMYDQSVPYILLSSSVDITFHFSPFAIVLSYRVSPIVISSFFDSSFSCNASIIFSLSPLVFVKSFAFLACFSIPLFPVSIATDIPAKINRIIIVIINAISVIPLFSFVFLIFFSFFVLKYGTLGLMVVSYVSFFQYFL